MLTRLEVPRHLHRNSPRVIAAGYEHSGETLINLVTRLAGIVDLRDIDVLDVGCGVRHVMTIINRGLQIKSYTGVELSKAIVDFLKENVEAHDRRFRFFHWNVRNEMYNPKGGSLLSKDPLAITSFFNIITAETVADSEDARYPVAAAARVGLQPAIVTPLSMARPAGDCQGERGEASQA